MEDRDWAIAAAMLLILAIMLTASVLLFLRFLAG